MTTTRFTRDALRAAKLYGIKLGILSLDVTDCPDEAVRKLAELASVALSSPRTDLVILEDGLSRFAAQLDGRVLEVLR